ncbi:hypothetical protein DSOUD_1730 [Desulfuromonas soudanensis]|uniref:Uncharacterized protein n=1 Tax=Desulfuromonas soudanensis TaxID=1603606 RepID=A0A0M4D191_9BACT|nr:hypothetical protein [Desulfuromonas soudanensis]ALC16508.1 hypothetical protein DSOUD_1730 [Desulfuromonas soudanensis]
MKSNPRLNAAILEVVQNQIESNDPPETSQTLHRLMAEGYSPVEAKALVGSVVAAEVYYVMKEGTPFDINRFVAALHKLPVIHR